MSKTLELARHLETLHINDMYKTDFYWTWDKTDDEIDAVLRLQSAGSGGAGAGREEISDRPRRDRP